MVSKKEVKRKEKEKEKGKEKGNQEKKKRTKKKKKGKKETKKKKRIKTKKEMEKRKKEKRNKIIKMGKIKEKIEKKKRKQKARDYKLEKPRTPGIAPPIGNMFEREFAAKVAVVYIVVHPMDKSPPGLWHYHATPSGHRKVFEKSRLALQFFLLPYDWCFLPPTTTTSDKGGTYIAILVCGCGFVVYSKILEGLLYERINTKEGHPWFGMIFVDHSLCKYVPKWTDLHIPLQHHP